MSTDRVISAPPPGAPTSGGGHAHTAADVERVVERLAARFPSVPPPDLRDLVSEEFSAFDGARIPTFVPVLAAKAATERLTVDTRPTAGTSPKSFPEVTPPPHDDVIR